MDRNADNSILGNAVSLPVVVLNTHHSGLGIARDLGPLGVRVIGVSADPSFPGNRSRWLEFRRMPDSLLEPAALLKALLALAGELGCRPILFPTRDHDVNFVSAFRTELENSFLLAFPAPNVMTTVMDKGRLAQVARSAGVEVPVGIEVQSEQDLEVARELRFPVV